MDNLIVYKDVKEYSEQLLGKINCVDFPHNMILIEPNNEYPFGCLIYKMVKGKPLNPDTLTIQQQEKLAKKIVDFNAEMHNLEIHWDRDWAINHELEKIDKNIQLLNKYLTEKEMTKLNAYKQVFSNYLIKIKGLMKSQGARLPLAGTAPP